MCKVPPKNNGRHREKGIRSDFSLSLPSRGKLKCIKHYQYMARLKVSQTMEPLTTRFLGC